MLNLGSDLPGAEWARLGDIEESGEGSPMLCTPLNIVDPFLQDNDTGILEIDEGRLEACWFNIESMDSENWLGYLWTDMSDYVLLCF